MAQLFCNLAKMLERNVVLDPQKLQRSQRDYVLERIETAERQTRILFHEARLEKARFVPIPKLPFGQACELLDMFVAEGGDDVADVEHSSLLAARSPGRVP
jgi:hypothetical protein